MVRGKFKLDVITNYSCGTKCFNIDNPAAQMQFALGEYYYLDFTPCVATK